jgi:hypothetical protein
MRNEQARYNAVQSQIAQLLDAAARDSGRYCGIVDLGRTWLAAEMYWRNERAHEAHEAREAIVSALEWRIQGKI